MVVQRSKSVHRQKQIVTRDSTENHSVFIGDYMTCQGCNEMVILVQQGHRWNNIKNAYLRHVQHCMKLRRLIVTLRQMKDLDTIKTDVIRCPNCKHQQNARVREFQGKAMFRKSCVLCTYVILESEWDVVVHHVEHVPPSPLGGRPTN